jgi:hypothetical protein
VKIRPFFEKVFFVHGVIKLWVSLDKEKGWQARNPSYMKEPKNKMLAKRGMNLIGLQSSSKTNAINVKNNTYM